jgi:hypothetical protein
VLNWRFGLELLPEREDSLNKQGNICLRALLSPYPDFPLLSHIPLSPVGDDLLLFIWANGKQ